MIEQRLKRGFAYLFDDGLTGMFFRHRDLLDSEFYRSNCVNDGRRVVGIIRAREKPDWLRRMWGIPKDGRWHPFEPEEGSWQGVRCTVDDDKTTYEYDIIERVGGDSCRERAANRFKTKAACDLRCHSLNRGYASTVDDRRSSYGCPSDFETVAEIEPRTIIIKGVRSDPGYGTHVDEFPG